MMIYFYLVTASMISFVCCLAVCMTNNNSHTIDILHDHAINDIAHQHAETLVNMLMTPSCDQIDVVALGADASNSADNNV